MLNTDTIKSLQSIYCQDAEMIKFLSSAFKSFENYHAAIYEMELNDLLYSTAICEPEAYREMLMSDDNRRTQSHNAVLSNINILNRLAETNNLSPVYSGIVSEKQPYRREVANAVLAFVEQIVKQRR